MWYVPVFVWYLFGGLFVCAVCFSVCGWYFSGLYMGLSVFYVCMCVACTYVCSLWHVGACGMCLSVHRVYLYVVYKEWWVYVVCRYLCVACVCTVCVRCVCMCIQVV